MPIKLSIDVQKIDKNRLYQGAKGKYLNVVLIETPGGQYGDYMVVQEVTKEEREAGEKGPILGNGKNLGGGKSSRPPQRQRREEPDDDIPW